MKILIFVGYFYPHKGGLEDYVYRLAKGLTDKDYEITILTFNSEKTISFEILDNIKIYRLDCYNTLNNKYPVPKPTIKNIKILRKLFNENENNKKFDFFNTHTRFWITSGIGLIFSKLKGIPLVHVEHGTCHTETNSRFVSMINKLVDHTMGSLVVRNAKVRIGVSNSAVNFMKHIGREGDLKISKGLELEKFKKLNKKEKAIIRKKLKISEKEKILTAVGRLVYGKGFQDLITAFSSLNKQSNNKNKTNKTKLIIIGDGDYRKELEELAKNLKISSKVLFLGEKNEKELIELLNITDIFINPSYSEGMPTTVLEAGALTLPVIATDVGGTRELIENNQTGILIPPKDKKQITSAIEFMLKKENQKHIKDYAKNLNMLINKEYSYNNMINKFQEVYEE